MAEYKRVVLDLSPGVFKKLNELKESTGTKSNTELFRYALGLLDLASDYQKKKYIMQFCKDDEIVKIAMPTLG